MAETLQPTSVASMIVRSYGLYFRMMPTLFGLLAVLVIVPLVVVVAGGVFIANENLASGLLLIIVGMLGFFAAIFYYYAAATVAVSLRLNGARAGILQILRRLGGNIAGKIIGTSFQAALRVFGGLLLLIVPGLVLAVRYILVSPVVILERIAYGPALQRSKQLVSANGWRVVGGLLLFELANFVIGGVIGGCVGLLLALTGFPHEQANQIITAASWVVSVLLFPVGIVFPILFYYDLRVRKEAVNLATIQEIV